MNNVESQISRMKSMMTYGLQTENKNRQYTTVEYQRVAADGKTYGIVREGTKFYIKVADTKKPNLVKEDFEYIGGFRNRKGNEYSSYANALKHFDMKMIDLKESTGNKTIMVESWNPEKNEYLVVEATNKMKSEINRQRQIMENASNIMEKKSCSCDGCGCATEAKYEVLPKGKGGDIFTESPTQPEGTEGATTAEKNNIGKAQAPKKGKAVKEAADRLAWHQTGGDARSTMSDTYLDTSNGTEIGSGAPFEKGVNDHSEVENGTVEEGKSMAIDNTDNQNAPSVGVGEIGDDAPFDKKVNEAEEGEDLIDDTEDAPMDGELDGEEDIEGDEMDDEFGDEDLDGEDDMEGEDDLDVEDLEDEDPFADDDMEGEDDLSDDIDELKDEVAQLKDMLSLILDKVGADSEEVTEIEFDDDSLYDDDEDEDLEDDEFGDDDIDLEDDDMEGEDDFEDEDLEDEDEFDEVHESRSYRRMKALNEEKLDYFGKHPAYRKKVMTYPTNGEDKNKWARDWNDDSVHGEEPYGQQIGSGAPFEVDPQSIDNAIAESIKRVLGKRK